MEKAQSQDLNNVYISLKEKPQGSFIIISPQIGNKIWEGERCIVKTKSGTQLRIRNPAPQIKMLPCTTTGHSALGTLESDILESQGMLLHCVCVKHPTESSSREGWALLHIPLGHPSHLQRYHPGFLDLMQGATVNGSCYNGYFKSPVCGLCDP